MANKNFPKKPGDVFFPFIALKYYGKVHKNLIIPDKKTATERQIDEHDFTKAGVQ